jgi:hypothetical protein
MSTPKTPDNATLPEPVVSPGPDLRRQPTKRRRMLARALLKKLNEDNCEQYGVSKVEISRLREAAYGSR